MPKPSCGTVLERNSAKRKKKERNMRQKKRETMGKTRLVTFQGYNAADAETKVAIEAREKKDAYRSKP